MKDTIEVAPDPEPVIRRGFESPDVDYKGPGSWAAWTSDEKAELIRDMMAMGNSDRPGWIILGVGETGDGGWSLDGVEDAAAKSFDPSNIGGLAKRKSDPPPSFIVVQAVLDSKHFPCIRVAPFSTVPHVCRESSGDKLQEGAVYVRTSACETSKVTTAEQMRALIERAVQIHADDIVGKIERLVNRTRPATAATDPVAAERVRRMAEEARKRAQ
jgi:predicted HTH transcriptional regulator